MFALTRSEREPSSLLGPILVGLWAAAIALAPDLEWKLGLLGVGVAAVIVAWIAHDLYAWLYLLFFCLLALPPLPLPGGDSGLHVGPLVGGIGVFIGLLRLKNWRRLRGTLPWAFSLFGAALLTSVGFAAFYSGVDIAAGSLARVFLFGLGVYVFAFAFVAETREAPEPLVFARFLFYLATAAALFACIDFYFQLPAPAGFGPQFVWLPEGVFRRAQGLFYEASTLGNFCAFFLVMILVCLFRPKVERPISRGMLLAASSVFGAALIFSYSRGSIINLIVAALAFLWLRRRTHAVEMIKAHRDKGLLALGIAAITAIVAIRWLFPSFSTSYWERIVASLQYGASAPDSILSGRLTTWIFLGTFLVREPWTAVFGIGYKTLPYSTYVGTTVVADNTYLQLLVETGIIGLTAFLFLNTAILRTGLRASQSSRASGRLFGEWIFCFWIGQMVQMMSGDLITYWRVLPAYFWVLANAAREVSPREDSYR